MNKVKQHDKKCGIQMYGKEDLTDLSKTAITNKCFGIQILI